MATRRVGGEIFLADGFCCTFSYSPATYASPAVGDLVVQDTAANWQARKITDNAKPLGRVKVVDSAAKLLTVEVFRYTQAVKLKYNGTIALGNDILSNGTNNEVDGTGTGDSTLVIAKDADQGYVEVLM
jgi:hypothetical protein